ncbi:YtxH domain-containing protein [Candidatus Roizmanbacteria bacterium]|nr:YtxH domain-containing protein [Candidatus Roizmanbacteria bacterium]
MRNQHNTPTNFWFGFAVGSMSAMITTYLLATKQGRETLKKLIELSENLGERSPEFVSLLQNVAASLRNRGDRQTEAPPSLPSASQPQSTYSSLSSVLDKIRGATQGTPSVKKFFTKDGMSREPNRG